MTKKTHVAVGVAATLPIIMKCEPIAFIGLLGAIVPDWDIILGMKHRTTTHSLTGLFVSTLLITLLNHQIGLIWGLNYSIHLLLDSMTVTGVPLFYPVVKKYYGFKFMKTGDSLDLFICLLSLAFIFHVF